MSNIIYLNKSLIIGKGKNRTVYSHPDNPDQCLKIEHHKNTNENNIDIETFA